MPGGAGSILVLNAGSSSIKFALFDEEMAERHRGLAAGIGGESFLEIGGRRQAMPLADHRAALAAVLRALEEAGVRLTDLSAAAHRVVHGGARLSAPVRLTPETIAEIAACSPLAPLHNPHNLAAIAALAEIAPDLPQYASFDTAFHATNPEVATRYAIPRIEETRGIRRYGFHGLSYASLVRRLPEISGEPLPARLLAFHLGNGASLCAILRGKSVATTMGYSPLDGLTMGTRSGGIDANAVLRLVEIHGLERTKEILNYESGLLGLSGGKSDMRRLLLEHTAESDFAVEHFCYWTLRHAGSLIAAMEGCDAIAFTGGIGENATGVRARICRGLEWLGMRMDPDANHRHGPRLHAGTSKLGAWVIRAEEERMIAEDARALMAQERAAMPGGVRSRLASGDAAPG
ncbi:MAG: acetate/propionate family kinase [Alphaproteobacteria bacterium]|nr:MAG: acetate/propionate family kinase [Alphaproteobacteria bacterium]